MQVQGFVSKINVKPTQYGNMHDLVVNNTFYGAGKYPPKGIAVGDYVQFEATQKPGSKYWNVAPGSLTKMDKPAGVAPPTAAPTYNGGNKGFDDRQTVISKQAALNSAMTFVSLLTQAGALPIAKKDMTPAKAADAVLGIVDHYTDLFYKQSTGESFPREDREVTDIAKAEVADADWNE